MSDTIERWEKMVANQPTNDLARFSLGKALFDAGRFAEARAQFGVALSRKPDWMVVQILLGKCQLALGDAEAARAAFQRALQLAIDQHHDGPRAELEQMLAEMGS